MALLLSASFSAVTLAGPVVAQERAPERADLGAQEGAGAPCEPGVWLEKALGAYRPNGKGPRTLHASSVLALHGAPGQPPSEREMVELYAFPGRARFEYRTPLMTAVTAIDGRRAWRISVDGPVGADAGHFTIPLRLRDLGGLLEQARASGKIECAAGAERDRQRLLLTLESGEMILVDVEEKTGLIRRYAGESPGTAGKADVLEVSLDGWHKMDGHWVALELTTKLNGQLASTTSTKSVKVGVEVPNQLFARPDGLVGPIPTEL